MKHLDICSFIISRRCWHTCFPYRLSAYLIQDSNPGLSYWKPAYYLLICTPFVKLLTTYDSVPRILDPGPLAFVLTPGSGFRDGKKSGSGIRNKHPNHNSKSLLTIFWVKILNFFVEDPDPGSGAFLNRYPGWKNSDPQHS
jgi:hypothetical protein